MIVLNSKVFLFENIRLLLSKGVSHKDVIPKLCKFMKSVSEFRFNSMDFMRTFAPLFENINLFTLVGVEHKEFVD